MVKTKASKRASVSFRRNSERGSIVRAARFLIILRLFRLQPLNAARTLPTLRQGQRKVNAPDNLSLSTGARGVTGTMALETETILDRRQLRRRLSFWRGLGIAGLALAIGALAFGGDRLSDLVGTKQIARVAIEGTILDDRKQLEMLRKISETENVAGVIVFVNSPGGTTAGGEALYEEIRHIAKTKPVVAQFGTVAASAGYIVGLGTDYIVARGNTITGSVGVIAQWPEVSQLLDKVGVKMNEVKSGELKAAPSPFAPADEPSLQAMRDMINDGFIWFKSLVEERRSLKVAEIPGLEKGRVFSGREALTYRLVDEIGGEAEARRWLEEKRGIEKDLKVVDWKPAVESPWGLTSSIGGLGRGLLGEGAGRLAEAVARSPRLAILGLDGLISVWQPTEN
jgi:protease IV